jgi:hypothetical protein
MKSGNLNFLEPSGPLQACNGTALPLPLPSYYKMWRRPIVWVKCCGLLAVSIFNNTDFIYLLLSRSTQWRSLSKRRKCYESAFSIISADKLPLRVHVQPIFWTNYHRGDMEVLRDRHYLTDKRTRISFSPGKQRLLIVNVNRPCVCASPRSPSFLLHIRWLFLRRQFMGIYV